MFPHRKVSAKALRRTAEQRRTRVRYRDEDRRRKIEAGTYATHQKVKRYTGVKAVNNYAHWNRKELAALVLPLTVRELAVLLHRSVPAVSLKIEYLKVILLYLEGKIRVKDLPPKKKKVVQHYTRPHPHGIFAHDNLNWLIKFYGLRSETFRQRDEFGNIIPTITRRTRNEKG